MKYLAKLMLATLVVLSFSSSYAKSVCSNMVGRWQLHFVAADTGTVSDFIFNVNTVTATPDKLGYYEADISSATRKQDASTLAPDVPAQELCYPVSGNDVILQFQWSSPDQEALQLVPGALDTTAIINNLKANDAIFTNKGDRMQAGAGTYLLRVQ